MIVGWAGSYLLKEGSIRRPKTNRNQADTDGMRIRSSGTRLQLITLRLAIG